VAGKVLEVNTKLLDEPELVNKDPYGEGWMIKMEVSNLNEVAALMDSVAYENSI
jgi:glycine cleavage system H protein